MTLLELQAVENEAYNEVKRIEETILEPAKRKWRAAYQAVSKAEEEAKIDAEVQRRLQERGAK